MRSRVIGISLFLWLLISGVTTCYARGILYQWKEISGDHFLVYYLGDEKFAREVRDKAEVYYRDIALGLGYPRYSDFWLWNNRVKIYIYNDKKSYLEATGHADWSEGFADYKSKAIYSHAMSSGFVDSLLPHEIAHLIFRDFVGFKGEVPLWLDEGVAQWSEEKKREPMRGLVKRKFAEDSILSIEDMMKIKLKNLGKEKVYIRSNKTRDGERGILFLNGEAIIDLYYLQGFALVDFLIERFGMDNFTYFCRQLRDGKTLEEALRFAFPLRIRNLQELEEEWRKSLEEPAAIMN